MKHNEWNNCSAIENLYCCVIDAKLELNKNMLVLGSIIKRYKFDKNPYADRSSLNKEGEEWMIGYHDIIGFIEIALDYGMKTRKMLETFIDDNEGGASND